MGGKTMKKIIGLIGLILLVACQGQPVASLPEEAESVRLILDTDLGPDYDDVGAMALMHALADSGQVQILATLSSNADARVVPCIEVINAYFNRPEIPVGATKSSTAANLTTWHKEKWTDALPAHYPHPTVKTSDAPDAVAVYRQLLAQQPDSSVVICTIGFFTNLKELLLSPADAYSPLSGKELVARKVKRLVAMAGAFPQGKEFNVYCDVESSKVVAEEWPTEIIFSGFEIGDKVLTGKKLVAMPTENSPVKEAFAMSFAEGDSDGRMSWDQTAVLVAIKGYAPYFDIERGHFQLSDAEGNNSWEVDPQGPHARLLFRMTPAQIAAVIEEYMMHLPQ